MRYPPPVMRASRAGECYKGFTNCSPCLPRRGYPPSHAIRLVAKATAEPHQSTVSAQLTERLAVAHGQHLGRLSGLRLLFRAAQGIMVTEFFTLDGWTS